MMTASGETHVSGVGYAPEGRVERAGAELGAGPLRAENIVVLSGGSLAGNAELRQGAGGAWEIHGDPTEAAFLVAERKLGHGTVTERRQRRFERIGEIPFTSERKLMTTLERDHEHDDAVVVITKGAPDVLLDRCTRARVGMASVELDAALRARLPCTAWCWTAYTGAARTARRNSSKCPRRPTKRCMRCCTRSSPER